MPTEPIKELDPEIAGNAKAMEILGRWADGVQECANFGTHVAKWCYETPVWRDDRALPLLLLFRNALELLLSISVLVRHGLADPCKILLRTLFETWMSIEYIAKKESSQRATCFLVWHAKRKRKSYLQSLADSPEYKQFRSALEKDSLGLSRKIRPVDGVSRYIDNLDRLLDNPKYRKVAQEFERVRKAQKRNPNWFSLYDGPRDVKQLADQLAHSGMYEIIYRTFSVATHGMDVVDHKISRSDSGLTDIPQIRFALHAQMLTSLVISFACSIFRTMVHFHRRNYMSKVDQWYRQEIQELQTWLASGEIITAG